MFNEIKNVFKSIIILTAIFFTTDQILGFGYEKAIDYVSSFWTRKYLKLHHAIKNEYPVIFTGDSRMMFSVAPAEINNNLNIRSFNLSFDALSLEMQTEFIKILSNQNKNLDLIVMNISSLWVKEDQESFNAFTLLYPLGKNEGLIKDKFPFEAKLSWINSLRYHKVLPDLLNGLRKNRSSRDYGYRPSHIKNICTLQNISCKLDSPNFNQKELDLLVDKTVDSMTYKHVDHLLDILKEMKTKVIFITIPFHSLDHIEYAKRDKMIDLVKDYLTKNDQTVIDFRNIGFESRDNLFRDTAHLNANGAIKFTKVLSKQLKLNL